MTIEKSNFRAHVQGPGCLPDPENPENPENPEIRDPNPENPEKAQFFLGKTLKILFFNPPKKSCWNNCVWSQDQYIRESDLILLSDIVNKPAKKVVKWAPKLAPGRKCLQREGERTLNSAKNLT